MLLGTIGGTAIGVVSLVGLALYLVGPGGRGSTAAIGDQPPEEAAGSMASAMVSSDDEPDEEDPRLRAESADRLRAGDSQATEDDAEPGQETGDADGTTNEPEPSTTVPPPTIDGPEEALIDELVVGSLLDPSLRPPDAEQIDGVFALHETKLDRVGGYVTINGLVFTSASALGGKERVALHINEIWTEASVVGIDRITDVAVMRVDEPDSGEEFLAEATLATAEESQTVLGIPGSEILVIVPGLDKTDIQTGMVISDEKQAMGHDGTSIYGMMQTSLVRPDGSPGSAIYDYAQNIVIGMVINSSDYTTTVIPIDRVLEVGKSFIERGVPAIEWLGVAGTNASPHGVAVYEVAEGGPAAQSGLQAGDIITTFGGVGVIDIDHLVYLVRETGVDGVATIEFARDDQVAEVDATVGIRPVDASAGP